MRVALTQMDVVWEDIEANLEIGERLVRVAAEAGADMIVFPEMSFTGFSMNVDKVSASIGVIEPMLKLSLIYKIAIVFGYVKRCGEDNKIEDQGKGINCLMVVQDGEVLTQYEKIHPFTYGAEGEHFVGGKKLSKCIINGIRQGFFICYDLRFPEIFQAVSEDCEVITVIANWPKERVEHWKVLLQARAIENQCYILGVNRVGMGNGLHYVPSSMGFDPYGNLIEMESVGSVQELLMVTVDSAIVEKYRTSFPLKKDRRKDIYKELYKEIVIC